MSRRALLASLVPAGLALFLWSRASGPDVAPRAAHAEVVANTPPADRVALLVALDRHAPGTPDDFPPLRGPGSDVRLIRELLIERFDFLPENIRTLANEDATHAGFLHAFEEHLIERSGPETEVLLWYSGHGSRVPDASGLVDAEPDGLDSTFVLFDSRSQRRDGSFDLTDDELHSLLAALSERTERIAVVTDACHSGAVLRGTPAAAGARSAPAGTRPLDLERLEGLWPAGIPLLEDGDPRRRQDPRWVHVAACSPRQVAREIALEIDAEGEEPVRYHGALSFYLSEALGDARPGDTWRLVADRTSARLADRFPGQTAWYEGNLERELFGSRFAPPPRGWLAVPSGAHVSVRAGRVQGLGEGSVLELFDARGERSLGRAVVRLVAALGSIAAWEGDPPEDATGAMRAVEISRAPGIAPLRVAVDSPELAELLRTCPWVSVEEESWDAYRVTSGPGGTELHSPAGLRLWPTDSDAREQDSVEVLARELGQAFQLEYRHRTVYTLADDAGDLPLSLAFVPVPPEKLALYAEDGFIEAEISAPAASGGSVGALAGREYHAVGGLGAEDKRLVAIEVVNESDLLVHVAVLSVAEDRSMNVIYPHPGRQDNALSPGSRKTVLVQVFVDEGWVRERPMRDRYVAVATPGYADFHPLTRTSSVRGDGPKLPGVIADALRSPVTRGRAPRPDPSRFGVAAVDLLVERPVERAPEGDPGAH